MSSTLRVELNRAFRNKMFVVALAVGLVLAGAQLIAVAVPYGIGDAYEYWRIGSKGAYPFSLYNSWLGATNYSVFTTLYFFLLPLLVCLPYADSLYVDLKSGYAANVVTRSGCRSYFLAKAIAVFLSAAAIALAPLVFNFLATGLFVPALSPDPTAGTFPVAPSAMWADLFYSSAPSYLALFALLTFVVAGLLACSCMVFAYVLANRFIVLVAPYLCSVMAFFLLLGFHLSGYSPINLLNPSQVYLIQFAWVAIVYLVVLVLEVLVIAGRSRAYEAL